MLTGLIMDKQNRKFSKSLGNGIDPIEMIENHDFSTDALRLFMLGKSSHLDMKISQNDQDWFANKKFLNKLWQSARFLFLQKEKLENYQFIEIQAEKEVIGFIDDFDKLIESRNFIEATRQFKHFYKEYFCDIWIENSKQNMSNEMLNIGFANMRLLLERFSIFCPQISDFIISEI